MVKLFDTIILLGTVQGFILSTLLFTTRKNKSASRLLAWLILFMALASLNLVLSEWQLIQSNGIIAAIYASLPLVVVMPMGPLIYFYIRTSCNPDFNITRRQQLHFLPILIDLIPSLVVLIFFTGAAAGWIIPDARPWGQFIDDYNVYADIPRWMSITTYLYFSSQHLHQLQKEPSWKSTSQFRWLWLFVRTFLLFQAVWLVYLIPYVIPAYTNKMLDLFNWYPVYLPLAVLIYCLGIKGYLMAQQENSKAASNPVIHIPPEKIEPSITEILRAMNSDQIFLNPKLSLADLAQHTGLAPKFISAVLNQHLQTNFNDFVNRYRIELFKKKLEQEESNQLTIAGIAQDCGFNSQATFQRCFKAQTGLSPSAYRQTLLRNVQ